ncbi:MAG: hypothetical protein NVS3B20_23950 [Polyangiales bacterium]
MLGIVQTGNARVFAHFVLGGLKEVVLQFTRSPVPVDRHAAVREIYALLSHGVLIERPRRPSRRAAKAAKAQGRARKEASCKSLVSPERSIPRAWRGMREAPC